MNALTKNIVIITLGTILCFGLYFWVVRPIVDDVGNLNKELTVKKTDLANLDQQIRAYQTAEIDLERATNKQTIANTILVKEDLETAIRKVEQAAAITGVTQIMYITDPFLEVKIAGRNTGAKPPAAVLNGLNGIREVPYKLSTASTYTELIDFISYLEHHPNFSEIVRIDLSAEQGVGSTAGGGARTGRVLANIDNVFFIQNATTETPKN